MKTFAALCTVYLKDGKKRLRIYDDGGLQRELEQYGEGEDLEFTLGLAEQRGTAAQRRFFHGPVLAAFIRLGWRKQEAKDMLALMFIPQDVRQMDGTIVRVPGHTSDLTKQEYNDFIESCIQLAAENHEIVEDGSEWRAKQRQKASAA